MGIGVLSHQLVLIQKWLFPLLDQKSYTSLLSIGSSLPLPLGGLGVALWFAALGLGEEQVQDEFLSLECR